MKFSLTLNQVTVSVISIVFAMISITTGASLAKALYPVVSPESVTFLRLTLSAFMLFFALKVWSIQLSVKHIWVICLYGLTIAGMNLFFYIAIKTIPIALSIELMGPLLVSIAYSKKASDYLWAVLAAIGIFLLIPIASTSDHVDPFGLFCAGVAAIFWGAYIVFGKKVGNHYGHKAPALGLIVASFLVVPFIDGTVITAISSLKMINLAILIALLSSLIPLMLEMTALRKLPTKTYGVLTSGEPVIGAIVSLVVLSEQLELIQYLGITIIVLASIGAVISPTERKAIHNL